MRNRGPPDVTLGDTALVGFAHGAFFGRGLAFRGLEFQRRFDIPLSSLIERRFMERHQEAHGVGRPRTDHRDSQVAPPSITVGEREQETKREPDLLVVDDIRQLKGTAC